MSTIDKIQFVPTEDILNKLWIKFTKKWATLYLEGTDWWKWHAIKWIFKDWAEKGRAEWDRLEFVKNHLWISRHEALKWFEDNFNIENNYKSAAPKIDKVKEKRNSLSELNNEQKEYLTNRGIEFSLLDGQLKNNNWKIALPIRKLDGRITSIQSRDINGNWRYYLEPWADSDWAFFHKLDDTKKALIVVEWFTDYLTLRQWTTNVYWLLNAWNDNQLDMLKYLSRKYKIYFIPDNDEAWYKAMEKMRAKWIVFNTFKLDEYWVKDINELVTNYKIWKELLQVIVDESEKPLTNITLALNKLKANQTKWRVKLGDWPLDKYLKWLRRWTTVLINWQSTWGKTTFSLYMLIHLLKNTDERIHYYSLETDIWEQILAIMWFYYWVSERELLDNLDKYDISKFEDRLFIYDDIREYNELTAHITAEKPGVFFLDFVQKLKIDWIYDEMQKMTFYAQEMQNFLIDNWYTIGITLSQVAMSNYQAPLIQRTPKNAWALLESSDVVINVWKDLDGAFKVWFYKCKGWTWWWKVFNTIFDLTTKVYKIIDDDWVFDIPATTPNRRF